MQNYNFSSGKLIFVVLFVIAKEIKNEKSLKQLKIEYIFIYSEQLVAL